MNKEIYLDAPNLGEEEKKYLIEAVDTNYVSTIGPFVGRFEKIFAETINVPEAVSLQSGTAALHMALHELDICEGDEVIVPALTFIASVNPIIYVRATPVFVDVDPVTWNIDPEEMEKAITPRTRAVIITHLYGNPCDMDSIMNIAEKHGIHVIEDSTESLGATYEDSFTGAFGEYGCFSFNGNKIITTGGGGMITGKNRESLKRIRHLINQARDKSRGYYCTDVGFNYRMTNIEAALGLAQIAKLKGFLEKKRMYHKIYEEELGGIPGVNLQKEPEGAESSFWLNCLAFEKPVDVEEIRKQLKERNIQSRLLFPPLIDLPPYEKYNDKDFTISRKLFQRGLCLPGSTLNSEEDIRRVCSVFKEICGQMKIL